MVLYIVLKALIVGALLGALIMFISSFAGGSTGTPSVRVGIASRFQIVLRFLLKLTVFILLLLIPFFLLRVIL
jgi:hypothetical protein